MKNTSRDSDDHHDDETDVSESAESTLAAGGEETEDDAELTLADDETAAAQPPVKTDQPRPSTKKRAKGGRVKRADSSKKDGTRGSSVSRRSSAGASAALVALGVVVGVGGGWLLATSRANATVAYAVGPDGSANAETPPECKTWSEAICTQAGEKSAACSQAKAAGDLLPGNACSVAIKEVPATIVHVKAARAGCTELVTRLCKELGEESPTCTMVKSKTEGFPVSACQEMLGNYDQVLGQLKQLSQRSMRMPGGAPPGTMPQRPHPGSAPIKLPPAH